MLGLFAVPIHFHATNPFGMVDIRDNMLLGLMVVGLVVGALTTFLPLFLGERALDRMET